MINLDIGPAFVAAIMFGAAALAAALKFGDAAMVRAKAEHLLARTQWFDAHTNEEWVDHLIGGCVFPSDDGDDFDLDFEPEPHLHDGADSAALDLSGAIPNKNHH
jgi:hypothetical protein